MPYPCMLLEVPTKNDQAQMQYAKLVELILEWNYFNQLKRWGISLSTAASTPNMAVYELAPHDKNPGKTLELARRLNSETDRLAEFIEARLPKT